MSSQRNTPPQSSYLLRILGGGYLVYLAWDVREAAAGNPLFWIPILIFVVVGGFLAGHSIWTLAHHGYFRKDSKKETESTEDWEDETNE